MATYVIGDVQGCVKTLSLLLSEISFKPNVDKVIFAGDVVNRGPNSLATLRLIISLGDSAQMVLGNHDLYLLMCACGGRNIRTKDTFGDVISAKDADQILLWLAQQPLILNYENFTIVHAGLLPQWSISQALALGNNFSDALKSAWQISNLNAAKKLFIEIWDDEPNAWTNWLTEIEKLRVTVNAMTRIRSVTKKGKMNFFDKGEIADLSTGYFPWFEIPDRQSRHRQIICGHWSALGLMINDDVAHIDTGCVWGRKLTALQIPNRKIFQVDYCD